MAFKILSIDVGTTTFKMGIYNQSPELENLYQSTYNVCISDGEKAEIDPEIWWQHFLAGCKFFGRKLSEVDIISFSVTTPGLVAMDKNGNALTRAILFLDQRSHKQAVEIRRKIGTDKLLGKACNLPVSGGSSLCSILWIIENQPEIADKTCKFGHTNTFFIRRLTGKWAIDPSTTSITGLYNTQDNTLSWNSGFLRELSIPEEKLPGLFYSQQEVGPVTPDMAEITGLPPHCKVLCGGNDAVLSAYSAGINKPGDILYISGTCDILMVCLNKPAGSSGYNIRTHILPGLWLTLFVLNTGGKSLEWFHSVFCSEMDREQFYQSYIPAVIEKNIHHKLPVYIPFLGGSRYSTEMLKAAFGELDVNTTRDDFLMALLRGNHSYMASHLEVIQNIVIPGKVIKITGGASDIRNMEQVRNKWLGDYHYEYIDQSALHGAAKLGKLFYDNQKL